MRRMHDIKNLTRCPNDTTIAYCAQFVADTLVINNIEPGYYAIKLINNAADNIIFNDFYIDFKYESTYGSFITSFVYDTTNDKIFALKGEWSENSKTLTLSLIDTAGLTIQSPTDIHVDIYRLA